MRCGIGRCRSPQRSRRVGSRSAYVSAAALPEPVPRPRSRWTTSRCPVEEIGRNSVIPSTAPRTIAWNGLSAVGCAASARIPTATIAAANSRRTLKSTVRSVRGVSVTVIVVGFGDGSVLAGAFTGWSAPGVRGVVFVPGSAGACVAGVDDRGHRRDCRRSDSDGEHCAEPGWRARARGCLRHKRR